MESYVLHSVLQICSERAVFSPLSVLTVGLEHSPELCFNMEPLLSIRDIFKARVMTRCTHLCFLFFRGQQNNRGLSPHIRLWSPHRPVHPVMDRAPQNALTPLLLPHSPSCLALFSVSSPCSQQSTSSIRLRLL